MIFSNIRSTLNFLLYHPLNKEQKLNAIGRYLRWQIGSRLVPGPVATKFVNNSMLLARPGLAGATGNIYAGLHEFEDMAFVLHYLRPDDLFVDIGANIGSYTILAGACAKADCIAFEPVPESFNWLQRNVGINNLTDCVEIRQVALGANTGVVGFTSDLDCCNHLVLDDQQKNGHVINVPLTTLDEALDGREPSMIKIDVEGFETEVLKGAEKILDSQMLNCVIIELGGMGEKFGFDESNIRLKLKDRGFGEYIYSPFERKMQIRDENSIAANTIFVRNVEFVEKRLKEAEKFQVVNITI